MMTAECLPKAVSMAFWFGFVVLLLVAACVYIVAELFPRKYRAFHYSIVLLTGISSLFYLAQANGLGIVLVDDRCFYALRWIDLMVTLPILLLSLSLVSTTYASSSLFLMGVSTLMVTAGLLGGFVRGHNHWLFFTFNVLAFLPIARALLFGFRMDAASIMDDAEVEKRSALLSTLAFGYLLVYHILYVLTQSLGVVQSDTDALIMTIGDVAVKALFAALLLSHRHVLDTIVDMWDEQGGTASGVIGAPSFGRAGEHSTTGKSAVQSAGVGSRETSALLRRARAGGQGGGASGIPGVAMPADLYVTTEGGLGIVSGSAGGVGAGQATAAGATTSMPGYYQSGV